MKAWRIVLIPLIILVLVLPISACSQGGNQPAAPVQQTTVVRGNLITKVSGSGKIAVSTDANLSFGSGGKLETLNVKEGDGVTKGAVLAELDTSGLEVQLAQSKLALDQAQLTQIQAETALTGAQFALDAVQAVSDIKDQMTNIEWTIKIAQVNLAQSLATGDSNSVSYLTKNIAENQAALLQQQQQLNILLGKDEYSQEEAPNGMALSTYYLYIAGQQYDRLMVEQVRMDEQAVETAQKTVDQVKDNIDQAQKNMDYVQKQIDEATIIAPFDGIVARLNVKQGDIIPSPVAAPQVIMYLVDLNDMEVDANIDEMDVPAVQSGQTATISVDALPGTTLEGQVTSISTIPNAQAAATGATAYVAKVDFTVSPGLAVKAGMNASVDIVTNEHKNVLLLPDEAIKKDNLGNSYVEIMNGQQVVHKSVVTGLSIDSQTEIVSGLNNGDKVVIDDPAGKWSLQSQ